LGILVKVLQFIYLFSCAFLVIIVLLQAGKGGGLAAAFGGGGGVDSAFGAKVGGPLRKVTAVFATSFLVLAIVLAIIRSTQSRSVIDGKDLGPAPPSQEEPADDEGALLPVIRDFTGAA